MTAIVAILAASSTYATVHDVHNADGKPCARTMGPTAGALTVEVPDGYALAVLPESVIRQAHATMFPAPASDLTPSTPSADVYRD